MNANVLRRFVVLLFVATLGVATFTMFYDSFFNRPPGDFETEKGDINLQSDNFDKALDWFDQALVASPNHRGAMMGRAIVFMETERYELAADELGRLIDFLETSLVPDDKTGIGALAAASANRGIVHDREGRYEAALEDYIAALTVDAGAVEGPGIVVKILYNPRPHTVRDRAQYLYEQLQLPESERRLRAPEIDAEQRRYKP